MRAGRGAVAGTDQLLGARLPVGRWSGPRGWEPLFSALNLVSLGGGSAPDASPHPACEEAPGVLAGKRV